VGLFDTEDHGNTYISGFEFGPSGPDISVGYKPVDGDFPEYLAVPTPGMSNETSPLHSDVCINEFLSTSEYGGFDDWIEVYNRGLVPVDISGWLLSDERGDNAKWAYPANTVLDPGEYLAVWEDVLGFGISSDGTEVIVLTAPDSTTGMDFYDPGPQFPDTTMGRYPDGLPYWHFLHEQTPNEPNAAPIAVDEGAPIASGLEFLGSYPNPFNPRTTLLCELGSQSEVKVSVYDVEGRLVRELFAGRLPAGRHAFEWDGKDAEGRTVASGIYLSRISNGERFVRSKMILVK
jgi:hypothetical protein